MKKKQTIFLFTENASLEKELSQILPKGCSLSTPIASPGNAIIFYDIDTLKSGAIRTLSEANFVIAVTSQKKTDAVIEATACGAFETLPLPCSSETISGIISELVSLRNELKHTISTTDPMVIPTCAIVGHSPSILAVCKKMARLSQTDVPVIITGETGTGKELIAESIAQLSSRFGKPFVVVNCAAVPEQLLESELFGFEKGSFTGALAAKEGLLKIAHEGTVFFDEVGELSPALQGKLLRFLQTQTFYPIGSTRELQVDVRVISATNRNLSDMVREGRFREDLYHRLSVAAVLAPPLRERKEDIFPLIHFFANRYRHTEPRPIKGITRAFLRTLTAHDWPGNIRELENTIRSAIALSKTNYLTTHELKDFRKTAAPVQGAGFQEELSSALAPFLRNLIEKKETNIYEKILGEVDRQVIDYVLSRTRENQSEAARLLGISRLTLRKKLKY